MFWQFMHYGIVATYLLAPVAAIVIDAVRARRRQRKAPGAWLVGVVVTGLIVGTSMAVLYAVAVEGKMRVGQAMLASYFAVGMLLLLRAFDTIVQRAANAALRVNRIPEKPTLGFRSRVALSGLV